ncbi:Flavin-binding monooxygenase-like family protein [Coccidioides posadasii C735 delta SOWgp]|uniref:Flavin-binding monooxygenase-like family protein n=1 Tax=Coccidioides posadasii (strain C735) TaxID=222929 RepID=C5PBS9_COCP7|nr:Flavin-binding monooxygenase-like family protein [Coccidioides posadasii C735 delta SOWgp]EER25406.1 Flavin-binding monooxygenase-like family protein [Coccidioides posadasii C735 delta SOWgp]|eukprot:XP_003067551.1 Flavin-binding monooxygenase-like family protein [Coccidioides posadasii C735 delta SOWgp]
MAPNNYARTSVGNKEYTKAAVVIIGAGISGLCTAINLIKNNIHNFVILEKSAGLGGTWRDNKYPGCCCDVYSHLYSFSFEQNPDWTRLYSDQQEILNYLRKVAAKYNLYPYIRFSSEVEESRWDEVEKKWCTKVKVIGSKDVEFGEEYSITSDFLVSGIGQLNYPQYPSIPGIETFKGKMMHSARWDWSYELKDKKIGIIGNGATAAQIAPEVAKEASHLTIFQRTPNWVVPRLDMNVWKPFRAIFRYCPPALWRLRASIMDFREAVHVVMRDPNSNTAELIRKASLHIMHKALPNQPDLWEKLTPDYPPGCKRMILSDDYFPTLARDNVSLETGHIDCITEKGIVIDGVEQDLDLIVLATGFRTVEFMHPIKIYGRDGRPLSEIWEGGARALYGVAVEDLPNFAMLYGPNTNLGHNSIILMIEAQSRYILALIKAVLRAREYNQGLAITPKPGKVEEFNSNLQKALSSTAFASPGCQSWYKTAEGLITNNWSGTVVDYQKLLSKLNWDDFDLEGNGAEAMRKKHVANLGRVREESLLGFKSLGVTAALAIVGTLAYKAPHLLPRWR